MRTGRDSTSCHGEASTRSGRMFLVFVRRPEARPARESNVEGRHRVRLQLSGWTMSMMVGLGLVTLAAAQTEGQGGNQTAGSLPMRPYGQLAGCSEEPARFQPCAAEKAKTF